MTLEEDPERTLVTGLERREQFLVCRGHVGTL
jgi:hypothetical protein